MAEYIVLVPADATSPDQVEQALRDHGLAATVVEPETPLPSEKGLRAMVEALVNEADESQIARLTAAATAEPNDGLDERFWGPAPDSVTAVSAVVADLHDQFSQRRRLAADSISREEAAELLGIAAQSVTSKLVSGKLIGIKVGREWRLPRWQFDPDNTSGVLPDLDALQAAFPGGPVGLSNWITRAQPDFDGRTPREEMIIHGSAPVITAARALTAAGW
ncbi:helix-turn-helix domain-containing protein [Mycobacterium sp. 663a-19]|uniref:helix-turn-helix domain-containing protein n=1 Tax=Mycobacterium sp. 663a-19 TaxID=2986148 RepID=UPI002D1EE33F|nr:helix-turn-helix domain-containing protein [Mycobacterium sp. 663a-19]MEB3982490.1 helix-turn-helix domain-containing protein [Mycobacterium sp. 663a-19]